jgi:hypothetical protein
MTVKLVELVAVFPPTVTVNFPVVAPEGIVVVIVVDVLAVTVEVVPLNFTVLLAGVVLKFVPVMVTVVPTIPLTGLKLVMMGNVAAPMVKSFALTTVIQLVVTDIFPVIDPGGTVVVILVAVLAVTVAVLLLKNFTTLSAGVVLKLVPVIVMVAPMGATAGVKEEIVGPEIAVPMCNFFINTAPGFEFNEQGPGSRSAVLPA